jgi:predicted permease
METLWQDLKYAARMLAKNPGFTAVAVLTLALGIGANTAIFSVVNALLLRPLPLVHQPGELAYLSRSYSYPSYEFLRDHNAVFSGLFAQGGTMSLNLNAGGEPELVTGELVTANFFSVLGTPAARGRTFLPEEDHNPGAHPVAVLSHGLWQRRFGADADILQKTILLNGLRFTIVGVMPAGFIGDEIGKERDLWVPMMMQPILFPRANARAASAIVDRNFIWMNVVGRLKPGVNIQQAEAALTALMEQDEPRQPAEGRPSRVELYTIAGGVDPRERGELFLPVAALLFAIVGLLLLTACSNLANLMLARGASRKKEIGVRLALGATRGQLVRQLVLEAVPLALLAGAAAMLLVTWTSGLLSSMELPGGTRITLDVSPDRSVLAFTLGVSLLTLLLFSLVPALAASRVDLVSVLKNDLGAGNVWKSRLRNLFVVMQVGLASLLLVGAGLFLRSLQTAQKTDAGFVAERVAAVPLDLRLAGYSDAAGVDAFRQIVERAETLPGVLSASLVERLPLGLDRGVAFVSREGADSHTAESEVRAGVNTIAPRYCETMGITVLQGREFTSQDRADGPGVALINQQLAARMWPNEDPIGKRLLLGGRSGTPRQVIGVMRDAKYDSLGERSQPYLFLPLAQQYQSHMALVVRSGGEPRALLQAMESLIRTFDRNLAVFPARTMSAHVSSSLALARLGAMLLGLFGAVGLSLAALGVFGVMAFSVSQRTREIGIRMALGAGAAEVLRMVLREGVRLVGVGLGAGLCIGLALAQLVSRFLYGVSAADPLTFAGVAAVLLGVAMLACYIPARRATKVDPMVALRYE